MGSTAQANRLKSRCWNVGFVEQGARVAIFRDPGATLLGESIREILLHREDIPLGMRAEMLLYMAARAPIGSRKDQNLLLSEGDGSSVRSLSARQRRLSRFGRWPSVDELWRIGRVATEGLEPSVTIRSGSRSTKWLSNDSEAPPTDSKNEGYLLFSSRAPRFPRTTSASRRSDFGCERPTSY